MVDVPQLAQLSDGENQSAARVHAHPLLCTARTPKPKGRISKLLWLPSTRLTVVKPLNWAAEGCGMADRLVDKGAVVGPKADPDPAPVGCPNPVPEQADSNKAIAAAAYFMVNLQVALWCLALTAACKRR